MRSRLSHVVGPTLPLLLACLLFIFSQPAQSHLDQKDVCVIGGGIGGMASAVFLKDLNYDVVVLEKEDQIGGCCHTLPVTAPPGGINYIDPGVQVIINTSNANALGYGPWTVDTQAFVNRFVDGGAIPPLVPATTPIYAADFAKSISYGLQPPFTPTAEFYAAVGRLFTILFTYPWLDTGLNKPDPIPAELLVPFDVFIQEHELEPLMPLFQSYIYSGGLGNFSRLTTLYALLGFGPSTFNLNNAGGGFAIKGGCIQLYNGMKNYLGANNVITKADINVVLRPPPGSPNQPSIVAGVTRVAGSNRPVPFAFTCDKIVVGIAPLENQMRFMIPDWKEKEVFDKVLRRWYYAVTVNATGPLPNLGNYVLSNIDQSRPFDLAPLPAAISVFRGLTYGPAGAPSVSAAPLSENQMKAVLQQQLSGLPSSLFTTVTVDKVFEHVFNPHFSAHALAASPSPYTLLNNLQGRRNTYYSSAILTFNDHAHIINSAYLLIQEHFPLKTN